MTSNEKQIGTKPDHPRIILHVGPGLEYFTRHQSDLMAKSNLARMTLNAAKEQTKAVSFDSEILPELMCNESRAVLKVMSKFRFLIGDETAVFSMATFSSGVFSAVLNTLIDVGCAKDLLVCLHRDPKDGAFTPFWLDDGCCLIEDWPYGILIPQLTEEEVLELNFKSFRTPLGG